MRHWDANPFFASTESALTESSIYRRPLPEKPHVVGLLCQARAKELSDDRGELCWVGAEGEMLGVGDDVELRVGEGIGIGPVGLLRLDILGAVDHQDRGADTPEKRAVLFRGLLPVCHFLRTL
jgi:hypothetical protein